MSDYDPYSDSGTSETGDRISNKASQLADKLVTEDGSVAGGLFKLPKPLRVIYKIFLPILKDQINKFNEDKLPQYIEKAAHSVGISNAAKVGVVTAQGISYIFPYLDNIAQLNVTRKDHLQNRKMILRSLAPLLNANKEMEKNSHHSGKLRALFNSGYEGNLMIEHALKEVNAITYNSLAKVATNALPNAILNYATYTRGKQKTAPDAETAKKYVDKAEELDKWVKGSGAFQVAADEFGIDDKLEDVLSKISFGKVLEIKNYLKKNELDGLNKPQNEEDHYIEVTKLVEATFQQFQKEQHRNSIPSQRLHEVSKMIAEQLIDGDMSYMSLFNVIGRGELLNTKRDGFISNSKIKVMLEKETKVLSKSATIDVEDFMNNRNYNLDDIKTHLASKDPDERALVVLLHPESVLLGAGMKKKEIDDMHNHLSETVMAKMFEPIVTKLSGLPDEELKEKGFKSEDIYALRNYAETAHSLERAMHNAGHGEELKNLIRTGMMGQDSTYWQEIIGKEKNAKLDKDGGSVASEEDIKNHAAAIYAKGEGPKSHIDQATRAVSTEEGLSKN